MDIMTLYMASRFASSSCSCLIVLFARIFYISFCVGVAFSSRSDRAKVAIISCFRLFCTSASFLYVLYAYSCHFSNSFSYRSGPFLAIENRTPLISSGMSRLIHFASLLVFPWYLFFVIFPFGLVSIFFSPSCANSVFSFFILNFFFRTYFSVLILFIIQQAVSLISLQHSLSYEEILYVEVFCSLTT